MKRSGVENTGANPVTDGGGDLLRFNRPSCVRRKISSGARLRFITPTETPIFNRRRATLRLRRSYARLRACERACVREHTFVCVYARTLKKRHCETGTSLSLPVFLSSRFTLAHVHTSAIASLFAPYANCCILRAHSLFLSFFPLPLPLSLSLSLSLVRFYLLSRLVRPFLLIVSSFLHLASSG